MTTDPGTLALVSLLLPLAAFVVLAIVAPFRRLGRPAAFFFRRAGAGWTLAGVERG